MTSFLNDFQRHSEYETYRESEDFIRPSVSYCEDENKVHYGSPYIKFVDPVVKAICVEQWGGLTGGSTGISGREGELSYKQAEAVTNEQLEGVFNSNTSITMFNEFQYFTGITQVSLSEDSAESRTTSPFILCSNLKEITLPPNVNKFGARAFDRCVNLVKLTNISNVRSFGFCSCQAVGRESHPITNEVVSISEFTGEYAFSGSTILTEIVFEEGLTEIPHQSFTSVHDLEHNLTKITFPSSLRVIDDAYVFQHQENLQEVIFPEGVEYIGQSAFIDCCSVTKVHLPSTVTYLGPFSFRRNTSLTSFTILATTPPELNHTNAFTGTNCIIYVPAESVEAYKAATNWGSLPNVIQAIPTE